MKRFFKTLKKHAIKVINYENKEMIPSTYEGCKSYNKQNVCYIWRKEFSSDDKKVIVVILLVNMEELLMMFAI